MLPKTNRYSFTKGLPKNTYSTPFFVLRYQNNTKGAIAVAIVVRKKVDKKAVVRNSIKRRFSEALRSIVDVKMLPFDLVFYIKAESKEKGISLFKEEIEKAFQTIHIV